MALTVDQMRALEALLDQALDVDPAQRHAWLQDQSIADANLRTALSDALFGTADPRLDRLPRIAAVPDTDPGLAPGQQVGPYRLERLLGEGGMAQVWLARRNDGAFERELALKVPTGLRLRADLVQRFAREREILAAMEHPNIAHLYDAGFDTQGLPFLAMEYVIGQPLLADCAARGLDTRARIQCFLQVLAAVSHAHGCGVLHRDLKPSNIMVTREGQVKLLDFGVARLFEGRGSPLTQIYGRALTPEYASPEQIDCQALDATSDIYSLGVVLHELLTGALPARAAHPPQVGAPGAAPQAHSAGGAHRLPTDLAAVLARAMAPHPQDRYEHVPDLAADLRNFLAQRPVAARAGSLAYHASCFLRRHRGRLLASLLLAAAAGALVLTLDHFARLGPPSTTTAPMASDQSLAVLPFANLDPGSEGNYIPDGLAEELIGRLGQVPGLRVTARTSSFRFRDPQVDVQEVARQLGVSHLLIGSVRREAGALQVRVQLVDARKGTEVWSQHYARPLHDVFALQDDIAAQVTGALRVALRATRPAHQPASAAHLLVLQGNVLRRHYTAPDLQAALVRYGAALRIDPEYADAWTQTGIAQLDRFRFAGGRNRDIEDARISLERAVAMDPEDVRARAILAYVRLVWDWDWAAAARELETLRRQDARSSVAFTLAQASVERAAGHLSEAASLLRALLAVDPLDAEALHLLGDLTLDLGHPQQALGLLERARALAPALVHTDADYGVSLLDLHRDADFDRMVGEMPAGGTRDYLMLVSTHRRTGRMPAEALVAFRQAHAREAPLETAELYVLAQRREEALDVLERATERHDTGVIFLRAEPGLAPLTGNPRYGELLRRLKLDDAQLAFARKAAERAGMARGGGQAP